MSTALSDRLKQTGKSTKQLALDAKATYERDAAQQLEEEAQGLRDRLKEMLMEILPESATIQFEGNVAVVDAHTNEALRFAFGCKLIGVCPRCQKETESARVHSLHQLGMLINQFEPEDRHSFECAAGNQTATPAERLVNAIREALQ